MTEQFGIWKTNHPDGDFPSGPGGGRWLKEKGAPRVFHYKGQALEVAESLGDSRMFAYEVRTYVPTPRGKWQLRPRGVYASRELAQAALQHATFLHDVEIVLVEEA
jgi:hypothetical protein